MTRHSKQHKDVVHRAEINGLNGFYDNNWGTLKVREGKDAKGDFDACVLCIHQVKDPLMCPKGHLYCKGCIYQFLLKQKVEQKEQATKFEEYQAKKAIEKEEEQLNEEQQKLDNFKKLETSITSQSVGSKRKAEDPLLGYTTYKTSKGDVYLVDKEIVKEHSIGTVGLSQDERKVRAAVLPCFWVPNLTPDARTDKVEAPTTELRDPFGNFIKRKQLKAVNFTLTPEAKKNPSMRKDRFMCPMSKKTFSNGMKLYFISTTGDVVTEDSIKLIASEGIFNGQKVRKKHVIPFSNIGSGFAAAGAKTVESRSRPAFAAI